ncbi:MAG: exodeoxyribonuclease V subunit gamma, partial [bacterium]|nr:exodeoxyribonuclease V subunit gamma [bacterium]
MSLRLVLGRAGSGKSSHIYREIIDEVVARPTGPPIWLIVPEQSTFQVEQALSKYCSFAGLMRARVISFSRLAHILMQEVSGGALTLVGSLGKQMIIRSVIEEKQKQLRAFSRASLKPGFSKKLAHMLSELKKFSISPAELSSFLTVRGGTLPADLFNKLHDLSLVYSEMQKRFAEVNLDSDDCLDLLAENVGSSLSLRDSHIYLDGFTGFTIQEYKVISQLLMAGKRISLCLSLDPSLLSSILTEEDPFFGVWETSVIVQTLSRNQGVLIEKPVVDFLQQTARTAMSPALEYLERKYFSSDNETYLFDPVHISIVSAANRRSEVEAVAKRIISMCRDERYRYRDIAIVLRDFSHYDYLITTVFAEFEIPHFLDRKRPIHHHPLTELIRSALETCSDGFSYDSMFRCLKTDFFHLSRRDIDLLENFVLANGIRGNRWFDENRWTFNKQFELGKSEELSPDDKLLLERIDNARRYIAKIFKPFASAISQSSNIKQYTQALFAFLSDLEVPKTLDKWRRIASENNKFEEELLHGQVWEAALNLFDEVVAALADSESSIEEFRRILETGLEGLELGLIPPELDQVVINSLDRSRSPQVKIAFILGVTEGIMPARVEDDSLLSEGDRTTLLVEGLSIGTTARRKQFDEEYLIYVALTRGGEKLYLTYPIANEEGAALAPSIVIKRIKEMFPLLSEECKEINDGNNIATSKQSVRLLAHKLRRAKQG